MMLRAAAAAARGAFHFFGWCFLNLNPNLNPNLERGGRIRIKIKITMGTQKSEMHPQRDDKNIAFYMRQFIISPRRIPASLCLTFLPALFLATVATGADTNTPPQNLAARLNKACAEKKIDDRLNALAGFARSLSLSEIPEALKAADGLKQMRERVVLTESSLERWCDLAPDEAFARIAGLPEGASKVEIIRTVVPLYARKDLRAAAAAAAKMKPGRSRNESVQMIAEIWAKNDAKAAIQWVNDLPAGFPKDAALHDIYFIWVHLDPAGISATVQNLPPGNTKNALIINVAGDWAEQDPAGAIRWAEALPEEPDKELALATVAESWADVDPVAAAEFALKLSPPELQQQAVQRAVERWATQDPRQAFTWAVKLPDQTLQEGAIARVFKVYVPVSPAAVARWVDELPAGQVLENAIGCYVEAVRLWDPGAGARLALKTVDPVAREHRVEQCFSQWLAWDPNSAKEWLKGTDFSDAVKSRWLSEKPNLGF